MKGERANGPLPSSKSSKTASSSSSSADTSSTMVALRTGSASGFLFRARTIWDLLGILGNGYVQYVKENLWCGGL